MSYVSATNVQGFIYYFGIFYLKIGKFYTFFSIGKGAHNGPQNQPWKIPVIKGCNSVKILRKMRGNNPKLDLVNVDVHTKFGQILSIRSQDIERKRNSDVNQGP